MKRSFISGILLLTSIFFLIALEPSCEPDLYTFADCMSECNVIKWFEEPTNNLHFFVANLGTGEIHKNFFWLSYHEPQTGQYTVVTTATYSETSESTGTRVEWHYEPTIVPEMGDVKLIAGVVYPHNPNAFPVLLEWTYEESPFSVVAISTLPMQNWRVINDTIIAVVFNPDFPDSGYQDVKHKAGGSIKIGQSWAFSDTIIGLEHLNWENEIIVNLDWKDEDTVEIPEGDSNILRISGFKPRKHMSVLVKYWVYIPSIEDTAFYFVNQAEVTTK